MALLPNSPAIDSADSNDAPTTDQRGYGRPAGDGIDIGAFEYGAVALPPNSLLYFFRTNKTYVFNVYCSPNVTYILQTSTDLKTWSTLENIGSFTSPVFLTFNLPAEFSTSNSRYFRLLLQ
jgi:hypothetical protein